MKYFEILTHQYLLCNKEFEEFSSSILSTKASHFVQPLGILTSDTIILIRTYYVYLLTGMLSCPILNLTILCPEDFALKKERESIDE